MTHYNSMYIELYYIELNTFTSKELRKCLQIGEIP